MKKANQNNSRSAESLFLDFANKILALMESQKESQRLHSYQETRRKFGLKRTSQRIVTRYRYGMLLPDENFLLRQEWAVSCAEKHRAEKVFYIDPSRNEDTLLLIIRKLKVPILDMLNLYNDFHPTDEQIRESYQSFKKRDSLVVIPLLNFTSSDMQCEQFDELELTPFTDEEKEYHWSYWGKLHLSILGLSASEISFIKFKLSGKITTANSFDNIYDKAKLLITALRLLKKGDVGAPYAMEEGRLRSLLDCDEQSFGREYNLSKSELPDVNKLFESLKGLANHKVAFRRFNQSYCRNIPEDKIIDLVIALESCLLSEDDKNELQYRFSLRGATILAKKRKPRDSLELLKAIYNARSKIVHRGDELKNILEKSKQVTQKDNAIKMQQEFLEKTEDIVRDVLKEYIHLLDSHRTNDLVKHLDKLIIDSLDT